MQPLSRRSSALDRSADAPARRTICVWLPRVRSEVEGCSRPDPLGLPIAVFDPTKRQRPLVEAPGAACWPGMSLREAQTRCPNLAYRPENPTSYAQAVEAILAALAAYSPTVEWSAEPADASVAVRHDPVLRYTVFLDATGLAPLYGSEERLAHVIARTVQEQTGHQARVGISDGRYAALRCALLADVDGAGGEAAHAPRLVPAGGDATFLAPLPANLLPLPVEARVQVARRWCTARGTSGSRAWAARTRRSVGGSRSGQPSA